MNLIDSVYNEVERSSVSIVIKDMVIGFLNEILEEAQQYKLFETHTIDELLFGYNNSLLWFLNRTVADLEEKVKFLHLSVDSYFSLQVSVLMYRDEWCVFVCLCVCVCGCVFVCVDVCLTNT